MYRHTQAYNSRNDERRM